jgi:hypothetical protein
MLLLNSGRANPVVPANINLGHPPDTIAPRWICSAVVGGHNSWRRDHPDRSGDAPSVTGADV